MEDTPLRRMGPAGRVLPAIVFFILILALLYFSGGIGGSGVKPNKDTYQIVYLSNGQSYMGKLEVNAQEFVLSDIFYTVSVSKQVQGEKGVTVDRESKLVKFGGEFELAGPEDKMVIQRNQVVLWENMRPESKMMGYVNQLKTQLANPPAAAPAAGQPAA